MAEFKKLEVGNILGESQYYKVAKIAGDRVQLDNNGKSIVVDKNYIEEFLSSGDHFVDEVKTTKTHLADLLLTNPRQVMTIAFYKQNKAKTKKAYKADLAKQAEQVQKDFLAKGVSAIEEALANPVLNFIPGELRIMRGRHYGEVDDMGRIQFVDMDIEGDNNMRQVDPRTLQYVIVNNVKYILK